MGIFSKTAGVGGSVSTTEIEDNSVTLAKLAHGTNNQIIGFDGTGIPVDKAGASESSLEELSTLIDVTIAGSDILLTSTGRLFSHIGNHTKHRTFANMFDGVVEFGVNPIINDDFSEYLSQAAADLEWVTGGSGASNGNIAVNVTNDNLDIGRTALNGTGDYVRAEVDLGLALSDTIWEIDFDLTVVTLAENDAGKFRVLFGMTDEVAVVASDTIDWLGFYYWVCRPSLKFG